MYTSLFWFYLVLSLLEVTDVTPIKKKRGRPKGSGKRVRGTMATLSAAEQAGAQAGMSAAFSAIGLSIQGKGIHFVMYKSLFYHCELAEILLHIKKLKN